MAVLVVTAVVVVAAILVVAKVVVVAAILVVVRAVVLAAREVLVGEEVVEAGLRAGRLVVAIGGGTSACGASAGEHAATRAAATAKAKAERFTITTA